MLTLPNFVSLLRIPLAFAFFQENVLIRALAVLLALLTDGLDGYLARRLKQTSRIGTFLDPLTDRLFVVIAVAILFTEHHVQVWKIAAMFSRDIAIFVFCAYLIAKGKMGEYYLRAIWCGKITTVLQLIVLLLILFNFIVPTFVYYALIGLGIFAFVELMVSDPRVIQAKS